MSRSKKKIAEKDKCYYLRNRDKIIGKNRQYNLKQKYGLTLDDYNNLFEKQEGRCAICGKHQVEIARHLDIDHDHNTGSIRGLLCPKCNAGLGYFESWYQKHIQQVTEYLVRH